MTPVDETIDVEIELVTSRFEAAMRDAGLHLAEWQRRWLRLPRARTVWPPCPSAITLDGSTCGKRHMPCTPLSDRPSGFSTRTIRRRQRPGYAKRASS